MRRSIFLRTRAFPLRNFSHSEKNELYFTALLRRSCSSYKLGKLQQLRRSFATKRMLHYEWVRGSSTKKEINNQNVLFLHGLLGSGKNLRTFAKRLIKVHPHLSVLLLDARGHGLSPGSTLEPPHTISNCAVDVIKTVQQLNLVGKNSPIGVVGHSFGGRIALEYLHQTRLDAEGIVSPPKTTWLLDTVPGNAHSSVSEVFRSISSIPIPIKSRKDLIHDLTNHHGVSPEIATWMTTNLVPSTGGGYKFLFDLEVGNQILEDFQTQDFYSLLEDIEDANCNTKDTIRVDLVRGGKNKAWTKEIIAKFSNFKQDFFSMHVLPNAGHWVHVDDLDGLIKLLHQRFMENE